MFACAASSPPKPHARGEESTVEAYERLKRIVMECEEDFRKADGGNKAAKTRVRKAMQDVKNTAQEIRQAMLSASTDKPEEGA